MKTASEEVRELIRLAREGEQQAKNAVIFFSQRVDALERVLMLGEKVCRQVMERVRKEAPGVMPS